MGSDFILSFRVNGTPPGAPENLEGTSEDFNIILNWDAPEDPGDLPVEGYRIFRRNSTSSWEERGTTTNLTYTDQYILRGQDYFYRVVAYNSVEDGTPSMEIKVGVPGPYSADDDDIDDDEADDDGGVRENEDDVVPFVIILVFAFIIAAVVVVTGYILTRKQRLESWEE
jgi:hypothetical protein